MACVRAGRDTALLPQFTVEFTGSERLEGRARSGIHVSHPFCTPTCRWPTGGPYGRLEGSVMPEYTTALDTGTPGGSDDATTLAEAVLQEDHGYPHSRPRASWVGAQSTPTGREVAAAPARTVGQEQRACQGSQVGSLPRPPQPTPHLQAAGWGPLPGSRPSSPGTSTQAHPELGPGWDGFTQSHHRPRAPGAAS